MEKTRPTYKYIISNSILYQQEDDYELSQSEFYMLYSFYVTYSCCGNQSLKKRTFAEYGWGNFARSIGNKISDRSVYLKDALTEIIDLDDRTHFIFITDGDDVSQCLSQVDLADGILADLETERCVCMKNNEKNRFLNLFYRIRDGFAHGKFLLKYSRNGLRSVIIQDDDGHNVTARIVLKLDTLLKMVEVIDKNEMIERTEKELCRP